MKTYSQNVKGKVESKTIGRNVTHYLDRQEMKCGEDEVDLKMQQ